VDPHLVGGQMRETVTLFQIKRKTQQKQKTQKIQFQKYKADLNMARTKPAQQKQRGGSGSDKGHPELHIVGAGITNPVQVRQLANSDLV